MLGFFFQHYDSWVDRYFIYDDGSDDGSWEVLQAHPKVECIRLTRKYPESWVKSAQHIYNNSWKRSIGLAEWVVVPNLDEHLYHHDMKRYLQDCAHAGINAVPSLGYQMISTTYPDPGLVLSEQCVEGAPWAQMSKMQIFNPEQVWEMNFGPGRHRSSPEGKIRIPRKDEVLNLHYKYLGLDHIRARHAELATGLRELDRAKGWGHRYHFDDKQLEEDFDRFYRAKVHVFAEGYVPDEEHTEPRWWKNKYAEIEAASPRTRSCGALLRRFLDRIRMPGRSLGRSQGTAANS